MSNYLQHFHVPFPIKPAYLIEKKQFMNNVYVYIPNID